MPRVGLTITFTDENGITRLASHEAETSYPVDNIRLDKPATAGNPLRRHVPRSSIVLAKTSAFARPLQELEMG